MSPEQQKFDQWCIVELFGHAKIAGRCTETNVANVNMLRVDVPETEKQPAFTRLFGGTAIYAINPIDEQICRKFIERYQFRPIVVPTMEEFAKKYTPAIGAPNNENGDDEDDLGL